METLFELTTNDLFRILLSGLFIYLIIILYLRVFGKRSTSELNNFDWIVTVSVGSIVASTVVLKDVSILMGGVGVFILFLLQFLVTKGMFLSSDFLKAVKSTPKLLLFEGHFLCENMKKERIVEAEIYAAIRQKGFKSPQQIYAVVLETNSKLSIIANENPDEIGASLYGVKGVPNHLSELIKKSHSEVVN